MLTDAGMFLPESVIIEVLSWLPVKSLLQLKCVCKTWCSIIESPHFVSKHLKNYYNNNTQDGCLLALYGTPPHWTLKAWLSDEMLTNMHHCSLDVPREAVYLCGPCNGILLLVGLYSRTCGLWNPATKEYRDLPITEINPKLGWFDAYGFGLDPITNQYKVVVIWRHYSGPDNHYTSRVMVHTPGTDFWRYVEDLEDGCDVYQPTCYTYLNGVYYWTASRKSDEVVPEWTYTVISFQMGEEMLQEIQVPNSSMICELALYKDSIALLHHGAEDFHYIWVLNDGYWEKHLTIQWHLLGAAYQVGFWKNGDIILCGSHDKLLLCDRNTYEVKVLGMLEIVKLDFGLSIYKPSLVSVNSLNKDN